MLNTLFSEIFSSTTQTIAVPQFLLCIAVALVIGIFLAAVYSYKTKYTKSLRLHLMMKKQPLPPNFHHSLPLCHGR